MKPSSALPKGAGRLAAAPPSARQLCGFSRDLASKDQAQASFPGAASETGVRAVTPSAAQPGVAAELGHVAVNLPLEYTLGMAFYPRHETRDPRSPALPAGFAPLARNLAQSAERRVVRPPERRVFRTAQR